MPCAVRELRLTCANCGAVWKEQASVVTDSFGEVNIHLYRISMVKRRFVCVKCKSVSPIDIALLGQ